MLSSQNPMLGTQLNSMGNSQMMSNAYVNPQIGMQNSMYDSQS